MDFSFTVRNWISLYPFVEKLFYTWPIVQLSIQSLCRVLLTRNLDIDSLFTSSASTRTLSFSLLPSHISQNSLLFSGRRYKRPSIFARRTSFDTIVNSRDGRHEPLYPGK